MSTQDKDDWVSELLTSLPAPELPADINARIESALASEIAGATVIPLRRSAAPKWIAGAIAVAAGAAIAVAVVNPHHSVARNSSAATAESALVPTGLNPSTLSAEVTRLLAPRKVDLGTTTGSPAGSATTDSTSSGGTAAGTVPAPAVPKTAAGPSFAGLNNEKFGPSHVDCAQLVDGGDASRLQSEEAITWEGQPAQLVVLSDPSDAAQVIDYVLRPSCSSGTLAILYQAHQHS